MKIAPSEAWRLDTQEINALVDFNAKMVDTDISMMINAQRKINGAKDGYLIK